MCCSDGSVPNSSVSADGLARAAGGELLRNSSPLSVWSCDQVDSAGDEQF